jgi:hypothetical protein
MKTKDFIKMLQEEDPSGECHIRMDGGFPYYVEQKAGYWDGAYSYIDDDGNYVLSTMDNKVDIFTMNIERFVEKHFRENDPNNWENIKSKIKFKLTYSDPNQRKERENSVITAARKTWEEFEEIFKNIAEEELSDAITHAENGWTWFQNKKVDGDKMHYTYYNWKIFDEKGKAKTSNVWNTKPVLTSDKWIKVDNNKKKGYYQWIYINK